MINHMPKTQFTQNFDNSRIPALQKQQTEKHICPRCYKQRKVFRTIDIWNEVQGRMESYTVCNFCADYIEKHNKGGK